MEIPSSYGSGQWEVRPKQSKVLEVCTCSYMQREKHVPFCSRMGSLYILRPSVAVSSAIYEKLPVVSSKRTTTNIGVSISGGGHRATLFGMGALLALTDCGLNDRVRWISSVSGGSLTNAFVATSCDFGAVSSVEFSDRCQRLISRLAEHGSITGNRLGTFIVAGYLTLGAGTVLGTAITVARREWLLSAFMLSGLVGLGALRGKLVERGMSRVWSDYAKPGIKLADLTNQTEHVFSTTDIRTGGPVFFSNNYIVAGGTVHPIRETPLKLVVRASAAFPVLLPPVRWALSRSIKGQHSISGEEDSVVLADGGVYNNLGTEWQAGLASLNHNSDGLVLSPEIQEPIDLHLVVDSGKKLGRSRFLRHSVPILGDLYSIARTYASTYGSTVASRRDFLSKFDPAFVLVDSGMRPGWGQSYAIESLRMSADRWRFAAWTTRTMGTHLNRISSREGTLILAHGYAVALASLRDKAQVAESELDQSWQGWLAEAVEDAIPQQPETLKKHLEHLRRRLK
jgi:predicted acylesterase/phospholipase RssA